MAEKTLAEEIANQLRRDILRGVLEPGTSIKERDNAAEMGVSRTPLREAIRILAKEGLVVLRPSRSPIVAKLNYKEVSDQTEVLIAMEKLSAELACKNATDEELAAMKDIVDYMDKNYDNIDPIDLFEIDMSFHTAIAQASHNLALAETHNRYLQRLWHARYLAAIQRRNRERLVNEHTMILRALLARNADGARSAIDNHLWHLAEDIKDLIETKFNDEAETASNTGDDE